ncbi:MAG: hypothetical protein HC934_11475 [Acaryochloridaceae cyanobacterium SU_2_1]|nr:hypothetical protein [Acaryochloridaceae cyanobacterium SU_2_1]NJM95286.1 hypothetical protein [Acaryochloridaceae cyanobacterium CSU_5_19]
MRQLKLVLVIGLLSLFSLTACEEVTKTATEKSSEVAEQTKDAADKAKDTATDVADKAKDTATDAKNKAVDLVALKDSVTGMQTGVTQTLTAVKAGDFAKAKDEFGKLQESWTTIKDNIKPESVTSIQSGLDTVKASLEASQPDKAKLITQLEGLVKSVGGIALK